MRHARKAVLVVAPLLELLSSTASRAAEQTLTLDAAHSTVEILLGATGHDVEGMFALRDGTLRFDSATGAASGEVNVDLASGKTGNGSRDNTVKEDVLETARFPVATLRATHLAGILAAIGSSDVTLEGTLSLHGAEHPVRIPAHVTIDGAHFSATAEIPVPFVSWGMKDPSLFVLRVDKTVQVKLVVAGQLAAAP